MVLLSSLLAAATAGSGSADGGTITAVRQAVAAPRGANALLALNATWLEEVGTGTKVVPGGCVRFSVDVSGPVTSRTVCDNQSGDGNPVGGRIRSGFSVPVGAVVEFGLECVTAPVGFDFRDKPCGYGMPLGTTSWLMMQNGHDVPHNERVVRELPIQLP